VSEAVDRAGKGEFKTAFVALRQIAKDRNINLSDFFGFKVMPSTIENMNNDVLDELLKQSKARLQLGLDLKGGVAFTLEIAPKILEDLPAVARKEKLDKAIEIITSRVNSYGVTEPIIRPVGDSRLEVQLPGVNTRDNPDVIEALQKPALLEFRLVHPYLTPQTSPEVPPGYERMVLEDERGGKTVSEPLYVKRRFEADGKIMSQAFISRDQYQQLEIILKFTSDGRKKFAQITRAIVDETSNLSAQLQRQLAPGRLAIILDGKLYSAPQVQKEIDSDSAQITGRFTEREALTIAKALNNPLDVPLVVKEQYEIGPSLAEDAVSSGLRAAIIGATLVAAFMIVFYTTGGLLAVVMLAINVVIIFGFMARVGAVLTLPGLAGIVLTMGMAVDANILIFERMREELAAGKTLSLANRAGFGKALWTILDAHFVQLLICGVMILFGTGPIRGFGVTLAIGVCSTLFSVLITGHLVLELFADSGILKKIKMFHLLRHAPRWDFVKYGKYAFICSWAVVIIGIAAAFMTNKAILGIDFSGGDAVTLQFDPAHRADTGAIRAAAVNAGIGETQATYVKAIGGDTEVLRIESAYNKTPALLATLQEKFPAARFESLGVNSIGASIGNEILWNAIYAILIAMLVTLLYIAFRFEFGFGVGAMFSSFHDILMVIGLFVLVGHFGFGFQFSAPMVAAILAIAGYSINETVVVFDRIREELRTNQGSLKDIVNTAINKVFSRTIMTSTTTLLAALALVIWGGGVLKEISFTFLVGIITSTFSAIFISSQVFYWWHKGDRRHVEKHQDTKPTYEWTGASKASE
jgi:SecD/SecF fusion protein